jgi:hypothetical protein
MPQTHPSKFIVYLSYHSPATHSVGKKPTRRDTRDWGASFESANRIAQLCGQWHLLPITFSVPITKILKALVAAPLEAEGASERRRVFCPNLLNGPQGDGGERLMFHLVSTVVI